MLIIQGKKIPTTKKLIYALPLLYGIGKQAAKEICYKLGFAKNLTIAQLTEDQKLSLIKYINSKYLIENNLEIKIQKDINNLIKNNSYRGFCHKSGLPVRGQRSRTNARTQKAQSKKILSLTK